MGAPPYRVSCHRVGKAQTQPQHVARTIQAQMPRSVLPLLLVLPALTPAIAQQPQGTTPLTVSSTLVQVPVQVKTKSGKNVYELTPDNFLVTDNGVPQTITLDDDTGSQPLALAIVAQTGGA